MNTLIISWFRYHPRFDGYDGYRVHWEYWLKTFASWGDKVDAFYLIDQGMEFTVNDEMELKKICPNTHILKSEVQDHHWGQFKWALPQIKGDHLLFLDNDVVIQDPHVVGSWFNTLKTKDFVGSFDGSGGLQDQVRAKFPLLRDLNATRMGTYYFGFRKDFLDKVGFYEFQPKDYYEGEPIPELGYTAVKGDWSDSFGLFTIKMLALDPRVEVIEDYRHSIYLEDSGAITKFPTYSPKLPYYHIRNVNLANYVMTSWACGNRNDYWREVNGNKRELRRLLAWFDVMNREMGDRFHNDVMHLVNDLDNTPEQWEDYIKEFRNYHHV